MGGSQELLGISSRLSRINAAASLLLLLMMGVLLLLLVVDGRNECCRVAQTKVSGLSRCVLPCVFKSQSEAGTMLTGYSGLTHNPFTACL